MGELMRAEGLRMAVFIDADNLLIAARDAGFALPVTAVMRGIKAQGMISYACAYGDWAFGICQGSLAEFRRNVINLVELPTTNYGKNSADIALAVDALEMVFSDHRPQALVLVAGDRDFVPLVLKVRRYGILVLGVGVRGSVSAELASCCDRFIYVDDLVPAELPEPAVADELVVTPPPTPLVPPAAEAEAEPAPQPPLEPVAEQPEAAPAAKATPTPQLDRPAAFIALANAIAVVRQDRQVAYGARVIEQLRRSVPGFDVTAIGFTSFRDFVQAATRQGLVTAEFSFGDMRLDLPESGTDFEDAAEPALQFDTPVAAARSYEEILATDKGVPLVDWARRKPLVEALWDELALGMLTLADMNEFVKAAGRRDWPSVPDRACRKIVHTLNIAKCFRDQDGPDYFQDMTRTLLSPAVSVDEALAAMHGVYVTGIHLARPEVPLLGEGIARMLFGDAWAQHQSEVEQLLQRFPSPPPTERIGDRFASQLRAMVPGGSREA